MAEGLKVAPRFILPLKAATETMGILAVKRAGKSNAAVVIAEEMYAAGVPWVAIDPKGDWWGIRGKGTGPGLSVLVMGGEHGDVPLNPEAGEVVADLIVRERITAVLDVSEMTKADQRRFLTAFVLRLYKTNREPLHVFCEEADEYIPQRVMGDMAKMVGAFETLVKRGGFRGIGVTLITQRSASLNNDVLTQVGTLFAMRTPHKADRDKVKGWVEYHAAGAEVLADIGNLHAGEAWVISPEWLGVVKKIHFRKRSTFDSGATPEVGVARQVPKSLADVDLDAVREAMAATIEQAEANDPKKLKKRVADLERELQRLNTEYDRLMQATPEPERVEVLVADSVWSARMEGIVKDLHLATETAVREFKAEIEEMREHYPSFEAPPFAHEFRQAPRTPSKPGVQVTTNAPVPSKVPMFQAVTGDLTGPQRKVLSALASHGPRDGDRLAMLSGYTMSGGFKNILGTLRAAEYITPARVTPIQITGAGIEALGEYEVLPIGSALLDWWVDNRLKPAEAKIVLALRAFGPMDTESLAEATEYTVSGGFKNILGRLRSYGLISPARVSPITLHEDMVD